MAMDTLGVWLRQTREAKDETLEGVRAATRIKVSFLEMLEGGEFDAFPGGEVQVRGFLRIYARHLGLSLEDVLSRYEKETRPDVPAPVTSSAGVQVQPTQPAPVAQSVRPVAKPAVRPSPPASAPSALPNWLSLETVIIACIVLIVVLVILIAVLYVVGQSKGVEEAGNVSPLATPMGALLTPTVTALLPAATPTFRVSADGSIKLTLEATEHVWARVTVDGLTVFEGIMDPDKAQSWSGGEQVIVDTGNGAGLLVAVNNQLRGVVGGRGEACSRAWGPSGEIEAP
jgi:cytoskeleton protein RodZ